MAERPSWNSTRLLVNSPASRGSLGLPRPHSKNEYLAGQYFSPFCTHSPPSCSAWYSERYHCSRGRFRQENTLTRSNGVQNPSLKGRKKANTCYGLLSRSPLMFSSVCNKQKVSFFSLKQHMHGKDRELESKLRFCFVSFKE